MVKIVGILNVTPDSFSDGGKFLNTNDALKHAQKLIMDGADIIDVGGESSRPGCLVVPEDEEIKRVVPVIKEIKKKFPEIPVSVDTYKPKVALNAIDSGAEIVNDIYGLRWSGGSMADVIAEKKVTVIIMHMKGTPQDMQKNPQYKDVVSEIYKFFKERLKFAKSKGIKENKIILDPGIGFGKTLQHNLEILNKLNKLNKLKLPIMVGPSRKSFIGALLNTDVSQRLEGTIAASIISVLNGADYLRVHDVLSIKRAITVFEAIKDAD
ncbi:MAG: dihydropteroate synthase [Elusimicrobia bacterium]|nr:dihydropteroate synthase [Elusimicrobiota bacterium]